MLIVSNTVHKVLVLIINDDDALNIDT
jgi:hypothetical protein